MAKAAALPQNPILSEEAKNHIGGSIYSRFNAFYSVTAAEYLSRLNPQASCQPYNQCRWVGTKYVITVRGVEQVPLRDLLLAFQRHFNGCMDCDIVAGNGSLEFSVPLAAVLVPDDGGQQQQQQDASSLLGFINYITQPLNLLAILMALVILFIALYYLWMFTPAQKIALWNRIFGGNMIVVPGPVPRPSPPPAL